MKVLYSRVSTVDQNEDRQLLNSEGFDHLWVDKCSGTIPFFDRPKGQQVKTLLDNEQLTHLEVHSIDRLGRSTIDVLKMWEQLTKAGITLVCRNPLLRNFDDSGNPDQVSEMIVAILSTMAKFENDLRRERQTEGIALAKARGAYKGRKISTTESKERFLEKPKTKQIIKLLSKGRSFAEITKIAKCSSSTVSKVVSSQRC